MGSVGSDGELGRVVGSVGCTGEVGEVDWATRVGELMEGADGALEARG